MLEQEHKAAEARQSKGGKPSSAGIHGWIPIQGNKCWIRRQGRKSKLEAFWHRPFAVGQRVGKSTWRVDCGGHVQTFHQSQMAEHHEPLVGKPWPINYTKTRALDDDEDHLAPDEWEVQEVLRHRQMGGKWQFLTWWKGFSKEDANWEPASSFLPRFNVDWAAYCRRHKINFTIMEHLKASNLGSGKANGDNGSSYP